MFFSSKRKRVYLDYASATPVRPLVVSAMSPYFSDTFGNAGAIHKEGVLASEVIERSREEIARMLHVRPQGIVFTGSGTESNNLAILGTIETCKKRGIAYADMQVVSTRIEHASIMETLAYIATLGVTVTYVDVTEDGLIDLQLFQKSLTPKTVLVAIAYVNSEIGVIQQVSKLARMVRASEKEFGTNICIHVDAAQAPLWLSCSFDSLLCDTLTLDAGKCYGPKGVGVVAYRHGVSLAPYMYGGSQEGGLRPGTENTALIVGATIALSIAQSNSKQRAQKVTVLRDAFIKLLLEIEGVTLNGSQEQRVANNVNVSLEGIDSEFAVITLDEKGISASTKSACGGAKGDGSTVVRVISGSDLKATSTIRFTLGEETTLKDIEFAVATLKEHVENIRATFKKLTSS